MTQAPQANPLIVTAHLDEGSFTELDSLRRRYFPKKLNKIPAHISLFHKLPGGEFDAVLADIEDACRDVGPFTLHPTEWLSLGRGVAIAYEASSLSRLHGDLSRRWSAWLSAQDRQGFRAHVTIQNKVELSEARALLERLRTGSEPPSCEVQGLTIWRYLDGPWEHLETVQFGSDGSSGSPSRVDDGA